MARTTWFNITRPAASADSLTIDIFDEIGFFGVSAKSFVTALKAAGQPKNITLKLDCPGGDCNDGFTIYDAIKATGANVTVEIVGLAASMASVIMLAGNTIRIAENGRVMIHRVTAGAYGNADELDAAAQVAKQFEDRIVQLYMQRTGQDEEQVREWMQTSQGTWFFGSEAVENGFADEVITGQKAKAFRGEWAAKFTMLPAALFDTSAPASPPRVIPTASSMKSLIKLAALVGVTGLTDDATEDQINAAIAAHKPQAPNVVIDFEDAKVQAAFDARIKEVTKTDAAKITALEGEITSLKALIKNGAGAAAGAGAPIPGAGSEKPKTLTLDEHRALSAHDRAKFFREGGKLAE